MKTLSELGISHAPWEADRGYLFARGAMDAIVAFSATIATTETKTYKMARSEEAANACLIAAAPDLYEALRMAYEYFEPMCDMECHRCKYKYGCAKWARRARAALEKAGGAE